MDIRVNNKEGALEILKSLPKIEQEDFFKNEYRKKLKLQKQFVLYKDNSPICFIEVYNLSTKDNYMICIPKEEYRGSNESYEFRRFILDTILKQ